MWLLAAFVLTYFNFSRVVELRSAVAEWNDHDVKLDDRSQSGVSYVIIVLHETSIVM